MRESEENMKAIIYGAGNIGRGFIGEVFSQAGYSLTFIDVEDAVVKALNYKENYPIRYVSNTGYEDIVIKDVNAVNGNDSESVAACIAEADIMATAVGANVLKNIVPNIVAGIRERFERTDMPLNIIICENLMDANKVLDRLIRKELSEDELRLFDKRIGLVAASIGRMVPVQTTEMQDGNSLRVCVEKYRFLPVDKAAFKGPIPPIDHLVSSEPFSYYLRRKLYLHNMSHSVSAYLGMYTNLTYIYEAIVNPYIHIIVKNAMLESSQALCAEYKMDFSKLLPHIDDLLYRYANKALGDTCSRVGSDPQRKLLPNDRLVGAANLCIKHRIIPINISLGIACGVYHLLSQEESRQGQDHALKVLADISEIKNNNMLLEYILYFYNLLLESKNIDRIYDDVAFRRHILLSDVV